MSVWTSELFTRQDKSISHTNTRVPRSHSRVAVPCTVGSSPREIAMETTETWSPGARYYTCVYVCVCVCVCERVALACSLSHNAQLSVQLPAWQTGRVCLNTQCVWVRSVCLNKQFRLSACEQISDALWFIRFISFNPCLSFYNFWQFWNRPILRVFVFFFHLSHWNQIWFQHIIQAIKWNHVRVCMFVIPSVSCRTISSRILMWWGWQKRESLSSSVLSILSLPNILSFKSGADFSIKKEGKKRHL